MQNLPKILLETSDLAALLNKKDSTTQNLRIVNANYALKLPNYTAYNPSVTPNHIFKEERIPTARHIDIALIGDKTLGLPCMLPKLDSFKLLMSELDIGINDHVVCYGDDNVIGACRAFWMFKVFGFPNVSVLNGTFQKWKAEGKDIESGEETWKREKAPHRPADFTFDYDTKILTEMKDVQSLIAKEGSDTDMQLFDTRKPTVFRGEPTDAQGVRTGHIPGFKNFCYIDLLKEDGSFKSQEEMEKILEKNEAKLERPTVVSCNSGMTASVVFCGLYQLGNQEKLSLYDGSWTEWVKHEENPVVKGD